MRAERTKETKAEEKNIIATSDTTRGSRRLRLWILVTLAFLPLYPWTKKGCKSKMPRGGGAESCSLVLRSRLPLWRFGYHMMASSKNNILISNLGTCPPVLDLDAYHRQSSAALRCLAIVSSEISELVLKNNNRCMIIVVLLLERQ
jgi:hypothetical protein